MSSSAGENHLIVGGGITGCVSALVLADRGASVSLYESSDRLGGILCDHVDAGRRYFTGCQYLSTDAPWFDLLSPGTRAGLESFEHTYGSVTEFGDQSVASRAMAMPVFERARSPLEELSGALDDRTLCSRLSIYPKFVERSLCRWAGRHGIDPAAISGENSAALQLTRVHFEGQEDRVAELKREPDLDAVLALPFARRRAGRHVRAALPAGGFDAFFDSLEARMIDAGVRIFKGRPVKARRNGSAVEFHSRSERLGEFDGVIWACNPNPLLKGLEQPILENVFGRSETHFFDLDLDGTALDTRYYQVFSDRTDIVRMFTYTLDAKPRLTVECFAGDGGGDRIGDDAHRLLERFGLHHRLRWRSSRRDRRYVFHTERDRRSLSELTGGSSASNCTILDAGWLDYGRDAKIDRVMRQL